MFKILVTRADLEEEESEEEEEDEDSDSPEEKKKTKKKSPSKHTGFSDSEYTPGKGKGGKPPPSVPKTTKAPPAPPTPSRKGVVLYHFSGDEEDGEIPCIEEGDEVTEVKPDKGGWTLFALLLERKG